MANPEKPVTPIPGALPLRPGDLDDLWGSHRHKLIANRAKFLVKDELEEPPHIRKARGILEQRGRDWRRASEEEICQILADLPKRLFEGSRWKRGPQPPDDLWYNELMIRIHNSEQDFYGFDSSAPGGRLLSMIRNARSNTDPASLFQKLKRAGVTIDKIFHFTRKTATGGDVRDLSLPLKIAERRKLFVSDLARFLAQMQGSRGGIPHTTYEVPSDDDRYIEKGLMKIDKHTLLFDTTLNNGIFQAIQEADFKPGIIMKQFTFWPDGADQDLDALKASQWLTYNTTHWLTRNYDVYSRPRGSGFVTCDPTIYIRKGNSLVHTVKGTASNLFSRLGPRS